MKNPKSREMMGALYRLYEKYEIVPSGDDDAYWVELGKACNELARQYPGNKVLLGLLSGLMDGLGEEWKEKNG